MPDELVTVVAQDADTGDVLMVAHGNAESLRRSEETGWMHYWSRSRGRLWRKGEESGNAQRVVSLTWDCDRDAVLAIVRPTGPACHTGSTTCFGDVRTGTAVLEDLARVIRARDRDRPAGSYVAALLGNQNLAARKVREEAEELIEAAQGEDRTGIVHEAADLVFHALVLLQGKGVGVSDVAEELRRRRR
jgi:phosphoribosyl-ATP pyrophosphohydrolase/phosphoribosyl-AMP cyclohydrolase